MSGARKRTAQPVAKRQRVDRNRVAANLKRAVQERWGHGVRALANEIQAATQTARGSSYGALRALMEGEIINPRVDILEAAARVMGVRPEWLIWNQGEMTDERDSAAGAAQVSVEELRATLPHGVADKLLEYTSLPATAREVAEELGLPYPLSAVVAGLIIDRHMPGGLGMDLSRAAVRTEILASFPAGLALRDAGATLGQVCAAFYSEAATLYLRHLYAAPLAGRVAAGSIGNDGVIHNHEPAGANG
jgi:hypothetical protein